VLLTFPLRPPRYCSKDTFFTVLEVQVGLAADVGTLQRLPKVIGSQSLVRELCYTGRKMFSAEALSCGLVSKVTESKEECIKAALATAADIAKWSPIAIAGTKINLIFARDHTVAQGLEYVATWNAAMLQSPDVLTSMKGMRCSARPLLAPLCLSCLPRTA
jgi:delta(3,5)-delta(2,4)-dienoyl-CoA isomerase